MRNHRYAAAAAQNVMAGKHNIPTDLFMDEGSTSNKEDTMIALRNSTDFRRIKEQHLYISAPMTGYPDLNRARIKKMEEMLTKAKKSWFSPRHLSKGGMAWLPCVNVCLEMIRQVDALVVLPGYEKSVGANKEIAEANSLRLPVYFVDMVNEEFDNEFEVL